MGILKSIVVSVAVMACGIGFAQASGENAGTTLWERPCVIKGESTVMPPVICKSRGGEVPKQYLYE